MRLKLVIAYKGTEFQGWQIQEKPNPPPTVQGILENVFTRVTGQKIRIFGSGRTDSGAHAHMQVAHLDLPAQERWESCDWRHILNGLLPESVRILSAEKAKDNFHARKDALGKTYTYNFWTEAAFIPPGLAAFAWSCGELDLERMRACLPFFLGEHDFSSFQNSGTAVKSPVRKIFEIKLAELPAEEFYPRHAPFLRLSISANGFLKQMARNMAGFLWKVGKGRLQPQSLFHILEARDRQALSAPSAPAHGLCLARVYYSVQEFPFPCNEDEKARRQ